MTMDIFKCLQELENGVRRGMVQKEETEKMGVPMVMGTGKDQKKLVDNVVSGGTDILAPDEKSDEESTDSNCKCKELMSGINIFGAARKGGVEKVVMPEKKQQTSPKKAPREMSQQQQIHEAKKLKEEGKDSPKAAKKSNKKKSKPKSKPAAKAPAKGAPKSKKNQPKTGAGKKKAAAAGKAKRLKMGVTTPKKKKGSSKGGASPKGTSGPGSGASGRTGPRKRRSDGEFWWAKDGNKPGTALWTKRGGQIVRTTSEQQEAYKKKRGETDFVPEGEDEHKKRTEMVQHFKDAQGLSDHITKKSRAELLKQIKNSGLDLTDKEQAFLDSLMSEFAFHKLTRGSGGPRRSPEQLKRDFIDGMDPQNYENHKEFNDAKKQVEGMDTNAFEAMIASIVLDEDEDDLRDEFGIERMSSDVHGRLQGSAAKEYTLNDLFKNICSMV